MDTQPLYADNDYPAGRNLTPKTFREIVLAELQAAHIPYTEYLSREGLLEVEMETGLGWYTIFVFNDEGGLLITDVARHEGEEDYGDLASAYPL